MGDKEDGPTAPRERSSRTINFLDQSGTKAVKIRPRRPGVDATGDPRWGTSHGAYKFTPQSRDWRDILAMNVIEGNSPPKLPQHPIW